MNEFNINYILAFIPYEITPNGISSYEYDYPEFRDDLNSWFTHFNLKWEWVEITLENYKEKIQYAKELQKKLNVLIFNFCDGSEIDLFPGISIIVELEKTNIPFTGGDFNFFNTTNSKSNSKEILQKNNVPTAPFINVIYPIEDIKKAEKEVGYPFLLKPNVSAASGGIYLKSVIYDYDSGVKQSEFLLSEQEADPNQHSQGIFAETFIIGEEYTVLVVGNYYQPDQIKVYKPIQRYFSQEIPDDEKFLSFHRYWNTYSEYAKIEIEPIKEIDKYYTFCPINNASIEDELIKISKQAYCALSGIGYARVDIRYHQKLKKFFVLEVNSNCGLSGEVDTIVWNILKESQETIFDLVEKIINTSIMKSRKS